MIAHPADKSAVDHQKGLKLRFRLSKLLLVYYVVISRARVFNEYTRQSIQTEGQHPPVVGHAVHIILVSLKLANLALSWCMHVCGSSSNRLGEEDTVQWLTLRLPARGPVYLILAVLGGCSFLLVRTEVFAPVCTTMFLCRKIPRFVTVLET